MENYELVDIGYRTCNCVNKHVPKPHKLVKLVIDDVEYFLCPTSFYNLVRLEQEWEVLGAEPPGSFRKHFSDYVQKLAKMRRFS
jgi:hypothetical protein